MAKLNGVFISEDGSKILVAGVEYAYSGDRAKAGDIVKVTEEGIGEYLVHGGFYVVDEIDDFDDPQITDEDDDNFDLCGHKYVVYAKVGVGSVASASVNAPTPKVERFKVGEYARVLTDRKDLDEGSIVKIARDDNDTRPFRCVLLDESDFDYYCQDELERITPEELKFAKFGRKLNEYKVGDVVKFQSYGGCNGLTKYDGVITRITHVDLASVELEKPKFVESGYGTYTPFEYVELIAPVESLQIAS